MFAAIGRVFFAIGLFILAKGFSDAIRDWRKEKDRKAWEEKRHKHWEETIDDLREEMKKGENK